MSGILGVSPPQGRIDLSLGHIQLLTVDEVIKVLRVCRDTVYRLAASGDIRGRKIGRVWRFPKDEIENYARGGQAQEGKAPTTVE